MIETFFDDIPVEYRVHPFWFWNGDMNDEQIAFQISEMADKGVGGFFLCARQGMTIPYLSDAWFTKVNYAIEVAKEKGLHVWLYDEYPYPSGIAGGEVILQHPDAKHRTLSHTQYLASDYEKVSLKLPWGRVISAVATPIDVQSQTKLWEQSIDISSSIGNLQDEPIFQKTGLTNYNVKRFFTYHTVKWLQLDAPQGNWTIDVFVEEEIQDFKYYGTFVDPGHREAMKTFIEITHARYKEKIGAHFGKTVKGIFTDEIGYLGTYPWSAHLCNLFERDNGYRLESSLQALVDSTYPNANRIRYDYFQTVNSLLRDTYHKQVHDWCEENGLEYIAEVPSIRMTTQLYSHVIGSDSAHDKLGRSLEWAIEQYYGNFRSNPKMTSSLARQMRRKRALVECFHSIGWSMTLQDAKWMIDRMTAMGVNFYNFHAFFYTLNGLTKHDAPPSQFLQNPYWKHFRKLGDYVGRVSRIMSEGKAIHSIALLDPTTSLWTRLGNPLHGFKYMGADELELRELQQLKADWVHLGKELLLNQISYDHLDSELLNNAEVLDGFIFIGDAAYSLIIIPPITNLESCAWRKLKEFLNQGGTVISCGLLPYEMIESQSPIKAEVLEVFGMVDFVDSTYWEGVSESVPHPADAWVKGPQNAYFIPSANQNGPCDTTNVLLDLLQRIHPSSVRINDLKARRHFLMECRMIENNYFIFVTNQENCSWDIPLCVDFDELNPVWIQNGSVYFYRVDLETGECKRIQARFEKNVGIASLHFEPFESYLIQLSTEQRTTSLFEEGNSVRLELNSQGVWSVTPNNENTVRFDTFSLTLAADSTFPPVSVPVKTFIDQCADIRSMKYIPTRFSQIFGTPMKMSISYPIDCAYSVDFLVTDLPTRCSLLMDADAISGDYVIYLNGNKMVREDFRQNFVYDHSNIQCPVQQWLKQGRNTLRIEVEVTHDWDGVIDAIYLIGNFGVTFGESDISVVGTQIDGSPLKGGPYKGYPFYAGTLSFKRKVFITNVPSEPHLQLTFTDWDPHFHDCAELFVNGVSLGVRAWSPYEWACDPAILCQGENELELQVTNTLIGTLEGKYFDYQEHRLRDVMDKF